MAKVKLSLPIGHSPTVLSNVNFCIGRPFRQPVELSDKNNFSKGLELWLNNFNDDKKLYAIFSGELTYIAAPAAGQPHSLKLELNTEVQSKLNTLPSSLEPIPKVVLYENIDSAQLSVILINLINTEYSVASGASSSWHPVLRTVLSSSNTTLKVKLDAENTNGTLTSYIASFVNDFMTTSNITFAIKSGDYISDAADPLAADIQPVACSLVNPKRVTIIMSEYNNNIINPAYYVWIYLKNANDANVGDQKVELNTFSSLTGTVYDHPLLGTNGINLDLNVPKLARVPVQLPNTAVEVILFPVGELGTYHGITLSAHDSAIQWRITNDANLDFEVQLKPGANANLIYNGVSRPIGICGVTSANRIDVCPTPEAINNTAMQNVWNDWEDDINEFCFEFQFPAEYIIMCIQQETNNGPRKLALEELSQASQNLLAQTLPQTTIDNYTDIDPKYGITVPDPIIMTNPVVTGHALTWGQLMQIVEIVPSRMSPGLIQTLVSTARTNLTKLAFLYPNIEAKFNVAAIPSTNAGLFQWLLVGRHSLLVSIFFHKWNYANKGTKLDLPLVTACYNAGSINYREGFKIKIPNTDPAQYNNWANPWVMRFNGLDYPRNTSRHYNAIKNNATILPRAKFWQSF